jgi:hypothetical protein
MDVFTDDAIEAGWSVKTSIQANSCSYRQYYADIQSKWEKAENPTRTRLNLTRQGCRSLPVLDRIIASRRRMGRLPADQQASARPANSPPSATLASMGLQ